jgi:hypothetical protein
MPELSESFYILLVTGGFAFLGLVVRYALKSACDTVECCCIKIHRNTEQENLVDIEDQSTPNRQENVERIQYASL